MNREKERRRAAAWRSRLSRGALVLAPVLMLGTAQALLAPSQSDESPPPTLEEARLTLSKWIETQQLIAKERNDWQQGKEILLGRLEVVKQEIATLEEKIKEAQSTVAAAEQKRTELLAEKGQVEAVRSNLTQVVGGLEGAVRKLYQRAPDPVQLRLETLRQRIPEDPATTGIQPAERFQNVLGILDGLNKANFEITVNYEVHTLADGKPTEVKAVYVGLGQAYYVSGRGDAGVGRPGEDGWTWEPWNEIAKDALKALEIREGKQTPAFVPLPVKIQ